MLITPNRHLAQDAANNIERGGQFPRALSTPVYIGQPRHESHGHQ